MRISILLAVVSSIIFAQEYSVQVMALKDEKNVTPDLLMKVEKFGKCQIIHEDGYTKVRVGGFDDYLKVSSKLLEIKNSFTCDAFLVKEKVDCKDQKMTMAKADVEKDVKSLPKEVALKESISESNNTMKTTEVFMDTSRNNIMMSSTKIVIKESPKVTKKESKKLRRKSELAEAMAFYANSDYYNFAGY